MSEQNQNQLVKLVGEKKEELWETKAVYLTAGQEIYFKRALISIMDNPKLVELSRSAEGAASIFRALAFALQMGLQIGGHIPQAYIVSKKTKNGVRAVLMPTMGGYRHIALSDPPVLKDFYINAVYEKEISEKFSIDMPNGIINGHLVHPGKERGKMVGVYAVMTSLSGDKTAKWIAIDEIIEIRNNRSDSYRAFLDKKITKEYCAWETDFDQMAIKTAGKRFLKPYAGDKEGLAMALTVSDEEEITVNNPAPIDERVNGRLDAIIENEGELPQSEMSAEVPPPENTEADIFGKTKEGDIY